MAKNKNKTNQTDKVVGVFLDETHAQRAIQALQSAGFQGRIADESAIKAFRDSGFEDQVVKLYRNRLDEGNTIVSVDSGANGQRALEVMLQNGAEYINLSNQGGQGASGQSMDANYYLNQNANEREYGQLDQATGRRRNADQMRLQLREETLVPVKQAVQAGEVEVRKTVHEKEQQVPVNVTRQEVYVERHAVDRPAAPGEIDEMQDQVLRVPVYEEQAELQKQSRVREEVTIGKQAVQEQQNFSGTVRHEHAEVVQSGNTQVSGDVESGMGNQAARNTQRTTDADYTADNQGDMRPYDTNAE